MIPKSLLLTVLLLAAAVHARAAEPDFHAWASTPPMGWNSWDCFGTTLTEAQAKAQANSLFWEVPYLPIDPKDVGRSYEAIIRINSQSGKGGIAYILQADYGLNLPRSLQIEFRESIQRVTDEEGVEMPAKRIHSRFMDDYVDQPMARLAYVDHVARVGSEKTSRVVEATIRDGNDEIVIEGRGTGPIDAFVDALSRHIGIELAVGDYAEHSLQRGSNARAIAYMEIEHGGEKAHGAGIDQNATTASLRAIVAAANRALGYGAAV